MDEIRKALADGLRVDLVWAPFNTPSIPLTTNYGHRSVESVEELEDEVAEHGEPSLAFIGVTDHFYIRN